MLSGFLSQEVVWDSNNVQVLEMRTKDHCFQIIQSPAHLTCIGSPLLHPGLVLVFDKHPPPRYGPHRVVLAARRQRAVTAGGHARANDTRDHRAVKNLSHVVVLELHIDLAVAGRDPATINPVIGRPVKHEIFVVVWVRVGCPELCSRERLRSGAIMRARLASVFGKLSKLDPFHGLRTVSKRFPCQCPSLLKAANAVTHPV